MAPTSSQATSQQEYLDSTSIRHLLDLQGTSVCCVGRTTRNKRCGKVIARKNFEAAKAVAKKLEGQSLDKKQGYLLIVSLAKLTLCPGYHWNQAETVSKRWFYEHE